MNKFKDFFRNIFSKKTWSKIFSLSGWKRWFLSFFIVAGAITTVSVGTTLYTAKNTKKSIEYGGGQEFLVSVNFNGSKESINDVAKSIANRINDQDTNITIEGRDKIKISKSGNFTSADRVHFESLISNKSTLIFTDTNGQPLFRNGVFVEPTESNKIDWDLVYKNTEQLQSFVPPIKDARYRFNQFNSSHSTEVVLANKNAEIEWTKLTEYISKQQNNKYLLSWLNIDELISLANTKYPQEWSNAKRNPYNFVYINEQPVFEGKDGVLKENVFNGSKYLVNKIGVAEPIRSESFSIPSRSRTKTDAVKLAEEINYGTAKYDLKIISSNFIASNDTNNAYLFSLIAIGVILTFLAIMLIVNYGLLGMLSTISLALYTFLTLTLITVLRGDYSPISFGSIILGLAICFDFNVLLLGRLKKEIYRGEKMRKAVATSLHSSLTPIFDFSILTMLISFAFFYFTVQSVRTFSISAVILVISSLIATFIVTRLIVPLLANTKTFISNPRLLGIRMKKYNNPVEKASNLNLIKHSKWFFISLLILFICSIISVTLFGLITKDWANALNLSTSFRSGTNITIQGTNGLNKIQANQIRDLLIADANKLNINNALSVISVSASDINSTVYNVIIKTTQLFETSQINLIRAKLIDGGFIGVQLLTFNTSVANAIDIFSKTAIALAPTLLIIALYVLVRYKWTYSIAVVFALILDLLGILIVVALFRIQVNSMFIIGFISALIFSLNDKLALINRIREIMSNQHLGDFIEQKDIEHAVQKSVRLNAKRSLYFAIVSIIINVIAASFIYPINLSFTLTFSAGIILSSLSTIFVMAYIWQKLEIKRQKGIKNRHFNKFWVTPGHDEQIFPGVNDFVA